MFYLILWSVDQRQIYVLLKDNSQPFSLRSKLEGRCNIHLPLVESNSCTPLVAYLIFEKLVDTRFLDAMRFSIIFRVIDQASEPEAVGRELICIRKWILPLGFKEHLFLDIGDNWGNKFTRAAMYWRHARKALITLTLLEIMN